MDLWTFIDIHLGYSDLWGYPYTDLLCILRTPITVLLAMMCPYRPSATGSALASAGRVHYKLAA